MSCLRRFNKWWLAAGLTALLVHEPALAETAQATEQRTTYTVKAGDVLSVIAQRQGVSLALLRKANGITSDMIRPGQALVLPTVHEVKAGDTLGTIAEQYGVTLRELHRHNELHEESVIKVGQQLLIVGGVRGRSGTTQTPERGTSSGKANAKSEPPARPPASGRIDTEPKAKPIEKQEPPEVETYEHEVRPNEVLSIIAARYSVSTKQLCEINQLRDASLIRLGQRLKIPITDANAHLTRPKSWSKYARTKFERGVVTLKTAGGAWTGRVLDEKGSVLPEARKRIQSMLASWETGKKAQTTIHPRLYQLIVMVSDEFGGRPLRIVSGYRQRSFARHSKHRSGRALDFSIPGVPNSALVDFLITLPNTGVGYYPNTTHVHMDARSSRMYWVDVSGPGQAPRYVHKSSTGERAPDPRSTRQANNRS